MQKKYTSFDKTTIYYDYINLGTSSSTIILLHGLGGDLTAWDGERRVLSEEGISSIALDLRGHGLSGRNHSLDGYYDLQNFVKDIRGVVISEGLSDYVIAGHCFGGMISVLYAGKYKDTKSMILIDTSYKSPLSSINPMCNKLLIIASNLLSRISPDFHITKHTDYKKFLGTGDFDVRRIINDMIHVSLKDYFMVLDKTLRFNSLDVITRMRLPSLILAGEYDRVFPVNTVKELSKYIKGSKFVIVKGVDHMIINSPEKIAKEMVNFLDDVSYHKS